MNVMKEGWYKDLPEEHRKCLSDLYKSWGIGNTWKQKRAFWNMKEPDTHISHVSTNRQWVSAFEFWYLTQEFPEYYISH